MDTKQKRERGPKGGGGAEGMCLGPLSLHFFCSVIDPTLVIRPRSPGLAQP